MEENLIYYGDAVKVLGEGRIGGYLVRFTDENTPDLEGDFFSPDTDLGIESGSKLPVYYQHGYDPVFKAKRIGRATAEFQDVGVWLEAQLEMRDEYERSLMELAEAGKLGWSSGAAGHLVAREQVGKSYHIKSWPIAEASLTPTPAEPRNTAISVKSLYTTPADKPEPSIEEDNMTDQVEAEVKKELDLEALFAKFEKERSEAVEDAVTKAIQELRKTEKDKKPDVQVVEDEADKAARLNPFKKGEFFQAVKQAALEPYNTDKRLKAMKASGANEAVPSEGGFLVQQDIANEIYQNMWGIGNVLSQFNAIPVSGNGLKLPAIDETSRAEGSRMGGVRAYWLAEGSTATSSKPAFRQINLELKKLAALVYATDELLADARALESWIATNVPNELRFMQEDAIIDGDGAGKPLGILQSGALISSTRADASKIADEDISGMWAHRYPGANDYVWFANQSIMPQLYAMTVGQQPVYQPPGGMADAPYGRLFGRPVIENEYCPYLGTVGDLLLASPSAYYMINKGGIESASSIHVQFDAFETAFRFMLRMDAQPAWTSSVTAFDGTNTLSPFVALAATT